MRNLAGQVPDPQELCGREDLLDHLWRQLDANNILLLAPRRFGKSGVMRHVSQHPKTGYLPLSFQLEDVSAPEEFLWRIIRQLLKQDPLRPLLARAATLPSTVTRWVQKTFNEVGFEGAKVTFKQQLQQEQ